MRFVNSARVLSSREDEQFQDHETHRTNCLTQADQAPQPEELKSFLSWGESVKREERETFSVFVWTSYTD